MSLTEKDIDAIRERTQNAQQAMASDTYGREPETITGLSIDDALDIVGDSAADVPDLLMEVDRLQRGVRGGLNESHSMQSEVRSSVTLAYLQSVLDELLHPTEGECDQ